MKKYLVSQFGKPDGLVGRLAGRIMANRRSNILRNRWTVELLDLQRSDRVLEIGFGPGVALAEVGDVLTDGYVVGLDHSATMRDMATKRNRRAVAAGRVRLVTGSVEKLDELNDKDLDGPFDHIFGVNVAMFWKDPVGVFRSLRERLGGGGRLAFTFQPRVGDTSDQAALSAADRMVDKLHDAGFQDIRVERLESLSPMAICVIARR